MRVGFRDGRLAGAHRLDLRTHQHEPRLERGFRCVGIARLAIVGDDLALVVLSWPFARSRRAPSPRGYGRPATASLAGSMIARQGDALRPSQCQAASAAYFAGAGLGLAEHCVVERRKPVLESRAPSRTRPACRLSGTRRTASAQHSRSPRCSHARHAPCSRAQCRPRPKAVCTPCRSGGARG